MFAHHVRWQLEPAWAPHVFKGEAKLGADGGAALAGRSGSAPAHTRTRRPADAIAAHAP